MYTIYINGFPRQVTLEELIMHEAALLEQMFIQAAADPVK